jgi:putative transposase
MEPAKAGIRASQIIISPVKLLPRTWAWMPKMSFRKSRDSPMSFFLRFLSAFHLWLEKKLKSLGLSDKKQLIEPKLDSLSLTQQCALLGLNRSSYYYQNKENQTKREIKAHINQVFEDIPIYGAAKVHQQLLEDGFKVSLNTVASYRQQMGLKAVLAVRQVNTTVPIKEHKKYDYKLRGLDISRANQVWSTDITYIKTKGGMVYLAAIIDWHSKAVLSHRISNIMD